MNSSRVRAAPGGLAIVRVADLGGTFIFAVEGALTAILAGLDPVGAVALAFVTAVGGGIMRDLLIGVDRPAAISDWRYTVIAFGAAAVTWALFPILGEPPFWTMVVLDAAGLALFAVAGTEKALDHGVHPVPAALLGTIGGVGGGALRDVFINQVPRIMQVDIYASAAFLGAVIVAAGRVTDSNARLIAVIAGIVCFGVRVAAVAFGWQWPRLVAG